MSQKRVCAALQAAEGAYLSGEELSRSIGITRAAVWKAVEALRRQGYDIEARTGRGYRLRQSPDLLRRRPWTPPIPPAAVWLWRGRRTALWSWRTARRRAGDAGTGAFSPRQVGACSSRSCGGPAAHRISSCPSRP